MTVKDLINSLSTLNPNAVVVIPAQEEDYNAASDVKAVMVSEEKPSRAWRGKYRTWGSKKKTVEVVIIE